MRWAIPVIIIERGRQVIVEADTKTEALRKLRERDWVYCTDADDVISTVTKIGPCIKVDSL